MKSLKIMSVMGMLGLALTLVPKIGLAADVSVGFFMGLPVPVVTFDPPRVHHVPPPVVVAPAPVYPRWHAYGPEHRNWNQKHFRHADKWKHDHRNFTHKYDGRGNGNDRHGRDGRWDRR
ncbi:MAG: hypothetical protein JW902_20225 [Syntrophaceae bacterium]|nr:hypothetical protein [Syntrophaceae bacterium]